MSKIFNQLLMLSGFYFILSFILSSWQNDFLYYVSLLLFAGLIVLIIWLCVKKNFVFLEKFDSNNPKVSNYLKAAGLAQYFDIFFGMIPSMFINTENYIPVYFKYASIVYLIILLLSLGYATYLNVKLSKSKKITNKKSSKMTKKK